MRPRPIDVLSIFKAAGHVGEVVVAEIQPQKAFQHLQTKAGINAIHARKPLGSHEKLTTQMPTPLIAAPQSSVGDDSTSQDHKG